MLRIHFLNVGHGDCTIIEHPSGRITMVDINNGDELDDDSFSEILAAYGARSRFGLRAQNTLAELASGRRPAGQYGLADILYAGGAGQPSYGTGLLGAAIRPAGLGLAALLQPTRNKRQELNEAGYSIGLTNPIEFYLSHFSGQSIFRYVQSHPDLDHMRGLAAIRQHGIALTNFWDTEHSKVPDFKNDSDKEEWAAYQSLRGSNTNPSVLRLYRGAKGAFWNHDPNGYGDHDGIEVLSPTPEIVRWANQQSNTNNLSYVLRITYLGYRIVLGGDADSDLWEHLADVYKEDLHCHVLKASHHGRDSGYSSKALALLNPNYTIVSVGKKPDTDASNKYRGYCDNVWSTRWYGNLTLQVSQERGMEWYAEHPKQGDR